MAGQGPQSVPVLSVRPFEISRDLASVSRKVAAGTQISTPPAPLPCLENTLRGILCSLALSSPVPLRCWILHILLPGLQDRPLQSLGDLSRSAGSNYGAA